MPYIKASIGKELSQQEIAGVYDILKDNITLIPGKTIYNAMMEVCPGCHFFMGGEKGDFAFIDIRLFGKAPAEAKDAYANAVCKGLEELLGIEVQKVYINFLEMTGWGAGGHFRGE